MAVAFGQFDVAMTATAQQLFQSDAVLGAFFAAAAVGSTAGGLFYGSRSWPGAERHRLPVALAGFAAGAVVLATVLTVRPSVPLPIVLAVLLATGLCIAPGLIIQQSMIDRYTAPDRRSEAQAWLTTAMTAGGAAGMSIAGVLVDRATPAAAFAGGGTALAAGVLVALAAQRCWSAGERAAHEEREPGGIPEAAARERP